MSRQITIFGASGCGNVGDDLLGVTLQEMLHSHLPDVKVVLRQQHLRNDIEKSHVVVIGGGGLLYDYDFENVVNYTDIIYRAAEQHIPVYMMGIGVQYSLSTKAKERYRDALRFVTKISTRNDQDRDYLIRELGCRPDQVVGARDLVFLSSEVLNLHPKKKAEQKKTLVLSVADWQLGTRHYNKIAAGLAESHRTYMKYLHEHIQELATHYHVKLVCQAVEDLALYQELAKAAKNIELVSFESIGASKNLISAYASADLAITGRYHGLIAGLVAGTPTISVAFKSHKLEKLINDSFPSLKRQFYTIDEFAAEDLFAKVARSRFVRRLRRPTRYEQWRTKHRARRNYQIVKMIAGELSRM